MYFNFAANGLWFQIDNYTRRSFHLTRFPPFKGLLNPFLKWDVGLELSKRFAIYFQLFINAFVTSLSLIVYDKKRVETRQVIIERTT